MLVCSLCRHRHPLAMVILDRGRGMRWVSDHFEFWIWAPSTQPRLKLETETRTTPLPFVMMMMARKVPTCCQISQGYYNGWNSFFVWVFCFKNKRVKTQLFKNSNTIMSSTGWLRLHSCEFQQPWSNGQPGTKVRVTSIEWSHFNKV
jgi:hypothetical protein